MERKMYLIGGQVVLGVPLDGTSSTPEEHANFREMAKQFGRADEPFLVLEHAVVITAAGPIEAGRVFVPMSQVNAVFQPPYGLTLVPGTRAETPEGRKLAELFS